MSAGLKEKIREIFGEQVIFNKAFEDYGCGTEKLYFTIS